MAELLDKPTIRSRFSAIPEWKLEGDGIRRSVKFEAYLDGIEFVRKVADLAEAANHHPDIDIRWREVYLTLTTHSAGGLTNLDFDLAENIDKLALKAP